MKSLQLVLAFLALSLSGNAQIKLNSDQLPGSLKNPGQRNFSEWIHYPSMLLIGGQYYAFQMNSRYTVYDTVYPMDHTLVGQTFDSLYTISGNSYPINMNYMVDSVQGWLIHKNHSGLNDTIIYRILDVTPGSNYPGNNVLWADTLITNTGLSQAPGSSYFLNMAPGILVSGKIHLDVQYYGAEEDTFYIVLGLDQCINAANDPEIGQVYRKTHHNPTYFPDINGFDSLFVDYNSNTVFDPFSCEHNYYVYLAYGIKISMQHVTAEGMVYADLNANSVFDGTDYGIPNIYVYTGAGVGAVTNASGYYSVWSDTGTINLNIVNPSLFNLLQTPGPITLNTYGQVSGNNNFGLTPNGSVNDLEVTYTPWWPFVPGMVHTAHITATNSGNTTLSPTVKLLHDNTVLFKSAVPPVSSISGDTLIWNLSPLFPYLSQTISVVDSVPANVSLLGDTVLHKTFIEPVANDAFPVNNTSWYPEIIIGSYDPNDKTPLPFGTGAQGYIPLGTPFMDYTIRFQNTGSYYAFNINIKDTIDTDLKMESLEILSASHPYEVLVGTNREITFRFANIMLPDSNMNEPQSHGYIRYRIYLNPSLALGTELTNTAYIYFDYNEAVITNTTLNTLDLPNTITESETEQMMVYPNPSNGMIQLRCSDEFINGTLQLQSADGKLVHTSQLKGKTQTFTNLAEGLYLVTLRSANDKTARTRLVIKK